MFQVERIARAKDLEQGGADDVSPGELEEAGKVD